MLGAPLDKKSLRDKLAVDCILTQATHPSVQPNGEKTPWIFDFKNVLLDSDVLETISRLWWQELSDEQPFQPGGLETTAIGLVAAVVMRAKEYGRSLRGFYARKSRKKDGTQRLIEGTLTDEGVILFDDLLNSGKSILQQVTLLEKLGKKIIAVYVVVRFRHESHYRALLERGISIHTIFTLEDFPEIDALVPPKAGAQSSPTRELRLSFQTQWKFTANNPNLFLVLPKSAPVLDDHKIYFGTDNGTFWALDQETGSVVWQFETLFGVDNKRIFSSPALHNKTVYFGSYDGNFYALDAATGQKKWVYRDADWIGSSPRVAPDLGLVFVGLEFGLWNKQGGIAALDLETGEKKWWYQSQTLTHSSPAYSAAHSTVVVGSSAGEIYAFNARKGALKWTFKAGAAVRDSFAIHEKRGVVCFGSEDGFFYCLNIRTGELIFKTESLAGFYSSPIIVGNFAYIGCLDKRVLCINLDHGNIEWIHWTNGRIFATPTLIDGHIFIGSNDGRLYELDAATGKEMGFLQLTERIVNRIVYNEKTKRFFVPTHANELYCVERTS